MSKLDFGNEILNEDIDYVETGYNIPWNELKGSTVMVTGATGLVGKMLILSLLNADAKNDLGMRIIALVRNKEKAEKIFEGFVGEKLVILVQDITEKITTSEKADYIIHCANITTSKDMVAHPVETIKTTFVGTDNILEYAAGVKAKSVVYLSSMEAYGVVEDGKEQVREEDLGYIDVLNVRSSYSEGKRIAECLCASYASEHQVPVKIARLAQTFGSGISKEENRVFAQFAKSIMNGTDIVLHTDGSKAQCFCYISDAVAGILYLMLKGENGNAYNVSNPETFISIKQMAQMLVEEFPESGSKFIIDIPEDAASLGYAPSSVMRLNSDKIFALGWKPLFGLKSMYQRLMKYLKTI